jgi:glucosamine--fructose-6-phosphate aminotransferase (isomerizing)
MCGIIGYVGPRDVVTVLIEGLKRLEYRGYDSAGIAVVRDGRLEVRRCVGKVRQLEAILREQPVVGDYGVGHTRWATHGKPSQENAHPHRDCRGRLVVVHNGIIENYLSLKRQLTERGHRFGTETDTEVIAHLLEEAYQGDLTEAVLATVRHLRGAYAFVTLHADEPGVLAGVRNGAPLVVGLGPGEAFLASDIPAVLEYTRDFIFLDNGEVAVVRRDDVRVLRFSGEPVAKPVRPVPWDPVMAQKGGYRHFMLKEIHEQPRAVRDTLLGRFSLERGRVELEGMEAVQEQLRAVRRVLLIACGTSYHACLVGRYMIEGLARLPAEADYASEFRYRNPVVSADTLAVLVSQSGETADTLGALQYVKEQGLLTVGVCNVVGSLMSREVDAVLYTHAGPEIGVASTKTFTTQMVALYLLALYLAQVQGRMGPSELAAYLEPLHALPRTLEEALQQEEAIARVAREVARCTNFLYLGRGIHYPIALEGALKLKEISYIHAEGYPAGEMKHGPIALIDGNMPVVALAPKDGTFEKMLSNMSEVKARDGRLIVVTHDDDPTLRGLADFVIRTPSLSPYLDPVVMAVPLQLLAYHVAVRRGCDVDQPRNLAKSVTVE